MSQRMNYTRDDIEETRLGLNRELYDEETQRVQDTGFRAVNWLVVLILIGLIVVPTGVYFGWWAPL